MYFQEFFKLGMDRDVPNILDMPEGLHLNLGAGKKLIGDSFALDFPQWDADKDPIPYKDGSVSGIHAYHFLEHVQDPVAVLRECQRVLKSGGVMNICVPYYNSNLFAQDLDHKKAFCEETWKNTFQNTYYDKHGKGWEFEIGFNMICGVVERNLSLLTQLVRK